MNGGAPCRLFGLHPTILLMASAHMMVDGYGNIYAPMLPLLIPRLGLTLAAAGTLTMLFQLAASVAQVGFGHLADRWRPRAARHGRPGRRGLGAEPHRPRHVAAGARADPDRRRPRRRGVPSARRRARASPRRRAARAGDVGVHHRRDAGVFARPAAVRAVRASGSGSNGRRCWRFPGWRSSRSSWARAADSRCTRRRAAGFGALRPVREAARAPVLRSWSFAR